MGWGLGRIHDCYFFLGRKEHKRGKTWETRGIKEIRITTGHFLEETVQKKPVLCRLKNCLLNIVTYEVFEIRDNFCKNKRWTMKPFDEMLEPLIFQA